MLKFFITLRRSFLRIDGASLLETFGSLKIRNFTKIYMDIHQVVFIYTQPHHALNRITLNLKTKEALHINWRKPNLNVQQNHLALTLSL